MRSVLMFGAVVSLSEPLVGKSARKHAFPEEVSPSRIFVSDLGWSVTKTRWDQLIAVDPGAKDRCHIKLLPDAFTDEEREKYVHETTAGPMWAGYSLWYFLETGEQHLFVIRPWWGRIRTWQASRLIAQKLNALAGRTAARDLYDIHFLARNFRSEWSADSLSRLRTLLSDVNSLESRFRPAFEEDDLFRDRSELLACPILEIQEAIMPQAH